MTVDLVLDGLVALLLMATIVYCVRLNRRLTSLRGAQSEMRELIAGLDQATARAQASMAELKRAAVESEETLRALLDAARATADELAFLVETGAKRVERLDAALAARPGGPASEAGAKVTEFPRRPEENGEAGLRSEAERELLDAVRRNG